MNKNSFTLFEIIISIILISIVYFFALNNFSAKKYDKKQNKTILNLKENLFKYSFNNNIKIKCTQEIGCFVFIDGELQEEKIDKLFDSKPTVYEYNNKLKRIEFLDLELEQLQRYEIVFEYTCFSNKKCDELIVETDSLVYIFNSFQKKPTTIKYINDIDDYFESKINEVKDAL